MRTFLDNRYKQLKEFFGKMQRKYKIRLAILIVLVIALAIVAVTLLGRIRYETLYTAESSAEAGRIYNALRDMGEPVKFDGPAGTKILVTEGKASELRNRLADMGVLENTGFNHEYLNNAAGFGVTDALAKQWFAVQRASDITTQLLAIEKVQGARVTVTPGEYSPFSVTSGVREAVAAVVLVLRNGEILTKQEAWMAGEIVRNNVPGIKYENITITDSKLNRYKLGDEANEQDIDVEMNSRIALQNLLSQQTQAQCEQLTMPIFGVNGVKVQATVRLNFDKKVTESVEFAPPVAGELDGIVRSSSELFEAQRANGAAEGVPGTDSNAMGTVEYPYVTLQDGDRYIKAVRERNYEINETRVKIEHEQGTIESVSVGIFIDEKASADDYSAIVRDIVAGALGLSKDNVAVARIPFYDMSQIEADIKAENEAEAARQKQKDMLNTIIMWAVILLLGLAFISLIKTIVKAVKGPEPEEPLLAEGEMEDYYDGIDYMADEDLSGAAQFDEIELNTKSSALEQIERFIDKDPEAVAQLLRNWLTDES